MATYQSFETDRLILRPTDEQDAGFILELFNSSKWIEHIGDRKVRTEADAKQYIRDRILPQLERLGYANYTLIRKSDGTKVGTCGLYDREGLEGVDIGFALFPAYERQGYAYEAASKLLELGFSQFGLTSIQAITTRANIASQRLLQKLGLTFDKMVRIPNDEEELMLFAIKAAPTTRQNLS